MRLILVLATWLVVPACGGRPATRATPPAAQGVEAYIAALRGDDPARAYALLSAEAQAQISFEEFALAWNESAAERGDQMSALEEGLRGGLSLEEQTKLVYEDGKTVYLIREGQAWKLDTPLVSRTHAGEPVEAARLFADALEKRDYDSLLQILTARRRESVSAQMESFARSLREHLRRSTVHIERMGEDRAELRWDDGPRRYKIVLRREGDEWRIDDVHFRPAPAPASRE